MAITYSLAKIQAQWSVSSEDRVETSGQTDGGDRITSHANAVGNKVTHCDSVMSCEFL